MSLPDPNVKDLTTLGIAIALSILGSSLILNQCNNWNKEQDAIHARNDSIINPQKYGRAYYQRDDYNPDPLALYDGYNKEPKKYKYKVIIEDDPSNGSIYEIEPTNINNMVKATKVSNYDYLNGTWEWECDEYLPTPKDQYQYIKTHYKELKRNQNK